jgi:glycosyltransferase involved in cell wall biosynthesis
MPLVTIGLPTYNARDTVVAAIRSVFAQSLWDWELLMVDDGSTDGSGELLESIRDPRVRFISGEQNLGLASRLNQIASLARGQYLARMDADDIQHPMRLQQQLQYLETHRDCAVLGTAIASIDPESRLQGWRPGGPSARCRRDTLRSAPMNHGTIIGRTTWFHENPYDTQYRRAQDLDLWCRTYDSAIFANLPDILYFVREGGSGHAAQHLDSGRNKRRIIRKYSTEIGSHHAILLLSESLLRDLAHCALSSIGLARVIMRQRNRRLTPAEEISLKEVLSLVEVTPVPGFLGGSDRHHPQSRPGRKDRDREDHPDADNDNGHLSASVRNNKANVK